MSFNWQNLRDDLYAYRRRLMHRAGYALLPVGFVFLAVPTLVRPSAELAGLMGSVIILACVCIGMGVTCLAHPAIIDEEIDYRYKVEVEANSEKLRAFLVNSGIEWTTKNYPNPIKQMEQFGPVDIHTTIFLTRLEDRMLLRMRF